MTPEPITSGGQPLLLAQLQVELDQIRRERQARRLAPALMQALGIRGQSNELATWIASEARTNEEAIAQWILLQLDDDSFRTESQSSPEIDLLARRLVRRLRMIESAAD